jgi:hypothetical protein
MPNIDYISVGDYVLPAIAIRDPPDSEPLTKYGMIRMAYLRNHRPIHYARLLLTERLYPHLRATQRVAEESFGVLMVYLAQCDPPPEKAACSLSWSKHMAGLHHTAEEIILAELIYK